MNTNTELGPTPISTPATNRLHTIDVTRGVVMIIMALDHVRDLIHVDSLTQSPTNLETTTPVLFFTRWITYLCAPTFVFLAGTSTYLSFARSSNAASTRNFIFKRGVYLVALEFVVVNFLLFFDFGYHTLIFEVIAAIGFGFIMLAALSKLSFKTIAWIGITIIVCHGLFGVVNFADGSVLKSILSPLLSTSAFPFSNRVLVIAYPPIPWLGIMLVGYACGKCFQLPTGTRRSFFLRAGIISILLFAILRYINVYGDSFRWSVQKNNLLTLLSFMNVSKYPPSLVFCLVTLGVMFLILALAERPMNKAMTIVSAYGKVPLFYFLLHFLVIHLLLLVILLIQGVDVTEWQFATGTFGRPSNPVTGLPLSAVYILCICVVAILYKPCVWFGHYKLTSKNWWLKYL